MYATPEQSRQQELQARARNSWPWCSMSILTSVAPQRSCSRSGLPEERRGKPRWHRALYGWTSSPMCIGQADRRGGSWRLARCAYSGRVCQRRGCKIRHTNHAGHGSGRIAKQCATYAPGGTSYEILATSFTRRSVVPAARWTTARAADPSGLRFPGRAHRWLYTHPEKVQAQPCFL
jgi:hypothetical protein